MILGIGHSLMVGNIPMLKAEVDAEPVYSKAKDIQSYGLWETSSPNLNTFYPGVTQEDLMPKDDDFVYPTFRLLSEVTVNARWNPTDFGKKGVLKASMKKLVGQTVYINHDSFVGNQVGVVQKVFWQESYETADGITVPAGINGVLKIDAKAHPTIARGIMMDPPSIHSNSVTVSFQWEPSHKFSSVDEFYSKMGTFDKDGELIRRIVTGVDSFHETSLVAHGADGFAQRVGKDGKIVNPQYGDNQHKLSAEQIDGLKKHYQFDFKNMISLSQEFEELKRLRLQEQNTTDTVQMKKLFALLALQLGLTIADDATEDQVIALLEPSLKSLKDGQAKPEDATALENLKQELQAEKDKVTALEKDKAMAELGKENLTALRADVKAQYTKLKGDKVDATILAVLDNADHKALSAMLKDYQEQLEQAFPMTCKNCGGHEVSRASAQPDTADSKKTTEGKLSDEEIRNKRRQGYRYQS